MNTETTKSEPATEMEIVVANSLDELFDRKEPTQREIIDRLKKLKAEYSERTSEAHGEVSPLKGMVRQLREEKERHTKLEDSYARECEYKNAITMNGVQQGLGIAIDILNGLYD